jgi:hypothetical protein
VSPVDETGDAVKGKVVKSGEYVVDASGLRFEKLHVVVHLFLDHGGSSLLVDGRFGIGMRQQFLSVPMGLRRM